MTSGANGWKKNQAEKLKKHIIFNHLNNNIKKNVSQNFNKMNRRILIIIIIAFLSSTILIGLVAIKHPIILKLVTGTARHIGKQNSATVYADGKITNDIEVFHVDRYWNGETANYYLVHFKKADTKDSKEIICVDIENNCVGTPVSTNIKDYDIIFGRLLQGEVGSYYSLFIDAAKSYGFDPKLIYNHTQIKFNLPPQKREFQCDSLRIKL